MPPRFLIDTSALARRDRPGVGERLGPLLERGLVATCGPVVLEELYSARDHQALLRRLREIRTIYAQVEVLDADFAAAAEILEQLAARGKHRSVGAADILIASCARRAGLTLMHYDSDFETVAEVTGQPTEWVVPRGSVP